MQVSPLQITAVPVTAPASAAGAGSAQSVPSRSGDGFHRHLDRAVAAAGQTGATDGPADTAADRTPGTSPAAGRGVKDGRKPTAQEQPAGAAQQPQGKVPVAEVAPDTAEEPALAHDLADDADEKGALAAAAAGAAALLPSPASPTTGSAVTVPAEAAAGSAAPTVQVQPQPQSQSAAAAVDDSLLDRPVSDGAGQQETLAGHGQNVPNSRQESRPLDASVNTVTPPPAAVQHKAAAAPDGAPVQQLDAAAAEGVSPQEGSAASLKTSHGAEGPLHALAARPAAQATVGNASASGSGTSDRQAEGEGGGGSHEMPGAAKPVLRQEIQFRIKEPDSATMQIMASAPLNPGTDQVLQRHESTPLPAQMTGAVETALHSASSGGDGSVTVKLSPGDLGEIKVTVKLVDGKVSVDVTAQKESTKSALLAFTEEVKAALADKHGLQLTSFKVESGSGGPADGGQHQLHYGDGSHRGQQGHTGSVWGGYAAAPVIPQPQQSTPMPASVHNGLVDVIL